MTTQIRRLTEGDGVELLDDVPAQRLRLRVRREVVAFLADLADASRADRGAGTVAFNASLPYASGTVGAILRSILTGVGEGQPFENIEALVAQLAGLLGPDQLTASLRERIDLIDADGTGLVDVVDGLVTTYGSTAAAGTSAAAAAASQVAAVEAAVVAAAARDVATVRAGEALTQAQASETSRVAAQTAAAGASTSATSAATSATSAAGSLSSASTQASLAAAAASTAGTSATAAASSSTTAQSAATSASNSASAANTSRLEAQSSAGSASNSASSAAGSATSAAGSASFASTQATLASQAAVDADNSADSSASSAMSAATSATNANGSASVASTQASLAAGSASAAGGSANAAATSASSAASSSSTAGASAAAANTSRLSAETAAASASVSSGSAAGSATSASGSASAAAASYNQTVAATGTLAAAVSELSTAVAGPEGLSAQHVLKVSATRTDGKKVFAAVGLAATAAGAAGESQILFQADKLLFVPPGAPNDVPVQFLSLGFVNGVLTLIVPAARIGDATIGPGKLAVPSLSTITANIGELTTGVIRNAADTYRVDVTNGRTVARTGAAMKVSGAPFGSASQFIEWYGPYFADLASCTEANATYYLKTNGSSYFGGALSAGVLKNGAQTTTVASDAEVIVGPFLTNGGTKSITVGYGYGRTYQCDSSTGSITGSGSATVVLEKSINGGAWTEISRLTAGDIVRNVNVDGEFGVPDRVTYEIGGATSSNDNQGATANMRLRARLIARTSASLGGTGIFGLVETQSISVLCIE